MINVQRNSKIEFIAYDEAMNSVIKEIDKALKTSPPVIRKYTEHLAQSGGKNIRALSVITCALNEEGMIHPNAVKAAASIELIHLASLVHDDVMDDADLRRGKETLQKKFGKKTAVICGDYLLSLALKISGSAFNKDDYMDLNIPDYMSRLAAGELRQNINYGNLDLTELEYFKTISGKTAALFEASFYAGAVISKCDDKALRNYMKLGNYAGMIFQITDDCMDFETTRDVAKKPVQSDFEQGVVTLPIIYALKNVAGLKEKITRKEISVNELRRMVEKSGGLEYTHEIAKKYYDKSIKLIDKLNVSQNKMSRLQLILDKVYRLA